MTRTPTKPIDDTRMWRWIIGRAHPDAGGTHEGFIWTQHVREHVCKSAANHTSSSPPPRPQAQRHQSTEEPARVPYPPGTDFREATKRALRRAASKSDGYGRLLSLLEDCYPLDRLVHEERRGASYKRLAAAAHMVGMTKEARVEWYRLAESIPLSDRHAGHILSKLKRRVA